MVVLLDPLEVMYGWASGELGWSQVVLGEKEGSGEVFAELFRKNAALREQAAFDTVRL